MCERTKLEQYSKAIKIVKATSRVRSQSQPVTVTRWSSPALVSRRDWCTSPSMTRPHSSRETFTCNGGNEILRRFISQHLEKDPTTAFYLLKTPTCYGQTILSWRTPKIESIQYDAKPMWVHLKFGILLVVWLEKIQRSHRRGPHKILWKLSRNFVDSFTDLLPGTSCRGRTKQEGEEAQSVAHCHHHHSLLQTQLLSVACR